MLIEKPGVSGPLLAKGAVGYIERFNPISTQLKTAIRFAISTGSLIQVNTWRLSQYAPTTPHLLLNDLFCHDLDLLLYLIEDNGYQVDRHLDAQAQLDDKGHLKIKMLFECSQAESSRKSHQDLDPSRTIHVCLQSIIGRGERRRSWCINQNQMYHLTRQDHLANPLFDQCNTVYHWSLSPQKPLPHPLCSIQESIKRVQLLQHFATQMF